MAETMRAAVYYRNDDVRIEEMAKPRAGAGELLVETRTSGICGSDVMEWYRVKSAPRVLGHEVTGVIAQAGKGVAGFRVGNRVCVTHHVPCNTCALCLRGDHTACETLKSTNFDPGGFAEFIRLPAVNVERGTFRLPDEVSDDAGVFVEPLGCVLRGLAAFSYDAGPLRPRGGKRGVRPVARAGGAPLWGRPRIRGGHSSLAPQDRRALRRACAALVRRYGGGLAGGQRRPPGGPRRPVRWRAEALKTALACVATCGVLQLFAPTPPGYRPEIDLNRIWSEQIAVTTTYGAAPLDLEEALALIRAGRVDVEDMVTHRLPLTQAQEGFRLVAEAGESLKVVLKP